MDRTRTGAVLAPRAYLGNALTTWIPRSSPNLGLACEGQSLVSTCRTLWAMLCCLIVGLGALPVLGQSELVTDDGLLLGWGADGSVRRLAVSGRQLPLSGAGGVFVRDEAASKAWLPAVGSVRCVDTGIETTADMGSAHLGVVAQYRAEPGLVHARATLTDHSGGDRALTIAFRLPVATSGTRWWRDLRRYDRVEAGEESLLLSSKSRVGPRGVLSVYPFSALSKPGEFGLSIGVPADQPRDYVMGVDGSGTAFIEFYVGLTRDTTKFPCEASVEWILYRHDPTWRLRDAIKRYYAFYPDHFRVRSPLGGAWLCGLTPGQIDTPDNERLLGVRPSELFRYRLAFSGISEASARADEACGLVTLPFIIALAKLRYAPKQSLSGLTPNELLDRVGSEGFDGRLQGFWKGKEAVLNSMLWDAVGQPVLEGAEAPKGPNLRTLQLPVNPDPELLAGTPSESDTAACRLFGNIERTLRSAPSMDGYYFDFVSTLNVHLSCRRGHFRWADFPATFEGETRQVFLHNRFSIHEFMRELRRRLDGSDPPYAGKLLWANGMKMFQGGAAFEAFLVDIVGFEWPLRGNWHDYLSFDFARIVAGRKPVVQTCNARPPALGRDIAPEQVAVWYRRMTLLGIPPIVREVFTSVEWMERHAQYVKLYVPLANRLQGAGWHPVPHARSTSESVWIERFGEFADGSLHFAVFNAGDTSVSCPLTCAAAALQLPAVDDLDVRELCRDEALQPLSPAPASGVALPLELEPYGLAVLALSPVRRASTER